MYKDFMPQDFNDKLGEEELDHFPVMSDHRNFVRYKFKRLSLTKPLSWLRSIVRLGNISGVGSGHLVVRLLLERIRLTKELLLLELENG